MIGKKIAFRFIDLIRYVIINIDIIEATVDICSETIHKIKICTMILSKHDVGRQNVIDLYIVQHPL